MMSETSVEPTAMPRHARARVPRFRLRRVAVMNLDTLVSTIFVTNRDETVEQVKARLAIKFGIPTEFQRLFIRTTELITGGLWGRLRSEQSEVILHVADTRSMQVVEKTLSGRSCFIDCVPSLTVEVAGAALTKYGGDVERAASNLVVSLNL